MKIETGAGLGGAIARLAGRWQRSSISAAGKMLGRIAYVVDVRHRRIIFHNLRFIYPHWSSGHIRQQARRIFEHFGIVLCEILQLPFISRAALSERVRIEGLEQVEEAMRHPSGCLIYSAHIGNWELGFLALSAKLKRPLTTVAKPIKLKAAHDWAIALRSRFGNQVFFKEGALPFMVRTLRRGNTVGMLIDQGVRRSEAVEVTFLGKRTMATPGPALLALRCRAPVVPLFCLRQPDGCYRVLVRPPVHFERSGSLRRDIDHYTQVLMASLEAPIRQHPEQWFWFHKRWKRTYPELYPEYQVLRRRKRLKKGLPP